MNVRLILFTTVWHLPRMHELIALIGLMIVQITLLFSMSRKFKSQLMITIDKLYTLS